MSQITAEELTAKKCKPCEGGVPPVPKDEVKRLLESLPGWKLTDDGQRIRRECVVKNFMAAMDFFNRVAELAEDEGHHPDLHLVGLKTRVTTPTCTWSATATRPSNSGPTRSAAFRRTTSSRRQRSANYRLT